jgi:hypothetical protein
MFRYNPNQKERKQSKRYYKQLIDGENFVTNPITKLLYNKVQR